MNKNNEETVKAELPEDETLLIMEKYATYLDLAEKQRQKVIDKRTQEGKSTLGYNKIKENDEVKINGVYYKVQKITKEKNGYQSIVFQKMDKEHPENTKNNPSVLAVGGSYGVTKFLLNPPEWARDWVMNNLVIGLKYLPPQLDSAIRDLRENKEQYNIEEVVGYSLGAILAGLAVQLKENKDIKAYLYNGGAPDKLRKIFQDKFYDEVNSNTSNIITMLAKDEPLTNLITIEKGSGIYVAIKNQSKFPHDLEAHDKLHNNDYVLLSSQSGSSFADTLEAKVSQAPTGGIQATISFSPYIFDSHKIKAEEASPDPIIEVKYIKQMPAAKKKKEVKEDNEGSPTGYAVPESVRSKNKWLIDVEKRAKEYCRELDLRIEREQELRNQARINYIRQKIARRRELEKKFEEYFRTVLDDFIIRMGYEMHDYN